MENRRTGRTTRIVDESVQEFFNNGKVVLNDHYWVGKGDMSPRERLRHILRVFLRRLASEHGIDVNKVTVDPESGLITRNKNTSK